MGSKRDLTVYEIDGHRAVSVIELIAEEVEPRRYVCADGGTWLPGVYDSWDACTVAMSLPPDDLARIWEERAGPDAVLTVKDLEST